MSDDERTDEDWGEDVGELLEVIGDLGDAIVNAIPDRVVNDRLAQILTNSANDPAEMVSTWGDASAALRTGNLCDRPERTFPSSKTWFFSGSGASQSPLAATAQARLDAARQELAWTKLQTEILLRDAERAAARIKAAAAEEAAATIRSAEIEAQALVESARKFRYSSFDVPSVGTSLTRSDRISTRRGKAPKIPRTEDYWHCKWAIAGSWSSSPASSRLAEVTEYVDSLYSSARIWCRPKVGSPLTMHPLAHEGVDSYHELLIQPKEHSRWNMLDRQTGRSEMARTEIASIRNLLHSMMGGYWVDFTCTARRERFPISADKSGMTKSSFSCLTVLDLLCRLSEEEVPSLEYAWASAIARAVPPMLARCEVNPSDSAESALLKLDSVTVAP